MKVVIDLYLRLVVGWSMKSTMATELVLDALMMAVMVNVGELMGHEFIGAEANPNASVDDIANLAAARQCRGPQVTPCQGNICSDGPEGKQRRFQTGL